MLQAQISAIMDVLVKAAVAEIGQLLEDDAAALHEEIMRRNEEIQGLKARLILTETKLQRFTTDRSSVAVQVEMMDTSVVVCSRESRAEGQDKSIMTSPEKELSEEKPSISSEINSHHLRREEVIKSFKPSEETIGTPAEEEDLSGLEFEMKIEQVEELVDEKLSEVQTEQKSDKQNHCEQQQQQQHCVINDNNDSDLWLSGGHPEKAFDHSEGLIQESHQQTQTLTDSYVTQVLMEDPLSSQSTSGLFGSGVVLENESFSASANENIEYSSNLLMSARQDPHRRSPTAPRTGPTDSNTFSRFPSSHSGSRLPKTLAQNIYMADHPRRNVRPKPFRCEECGKGFTQKTRLVTHRRVHTGEKPFRCQLCGKMFSRQDNCLRHVRLHSGQHW